MSDRVDLISHIHMLKERGHWDRLCEISAQCGIKPHSVIAAISNQGEMAKKRTLARKMFCQELQINGASVREIGALLHLGETQTRKYMMRRPLLAQRGPSMQRATEMCKGIGEAYGVSGAGVFSVNWSKDPARSEARRCACAFLHRHGYTLNRLAHMFRQNTVKVREWIDSFDLNELLTAAMRNEAA